eukprot:83978_1
MSRDICCLKSDAKEAKHATTLTKTKGIYIVCEGHEVGYSASGSPPLNRVRVRMRHYTKRMEEDHTKHLLAIMAQRMDQNIPFFLGGNMYLIYLMTRLLAFCYAFKYVALSF